MSARDWAHIGRAEFERGLPDDTVAILPTAAIEQHGPHLPVGVDTLIMNGMLDRLRATCPDDLNVVILPVQAVGKSNEHLDVPGTLTLDAATALSSWTQIGLSIARAGVRRVALANSHGGNLDLVSILSRELRVQAGMLAVKFQWGAFGTPPGMFSDREKSFGIHGGDYETSVMLHLHPDLVDMKSARDFVSAAESWDILPTGPISRGWMASDLSDAGTVGEAHLATPEKGRKALEHQVEGALSLLRQIATTRIDAIAPCKG
ncbi:creatininase family protein [Palleronia sp. LCG004]|uniref:creatininase family protein n=1 Tax=Palleronia sp. LCG004 TaxID=3079304 RepID=UPI002943CECC|nr:creatininase family protein [Palleronia sp. LCG004]WOI58343.1 creatininase family protein [Palleronia sp. LCG004]